MALRRIGLIARNFWRRVTGAIPGKTPFQEADELRTLQIATGEYAVSRLQAEIGNLDDPAEEVSELILEYQQSLIALRAARPSVTAAIVRNPKDTAEVEQYGLRCELEQIQAMYEADRISRATAKRLRENVHLMQIDLEGRI